MSYYQQRLQQLSITDDLNQVLLWRNIKKDGDSAHHNTLVPEQIFREHEKGIEIIVYTIDRLQPTYTGENSRWKKNWSIVRYEKPIVKANGDELKYLMPKGQGSYPFFPPALLDKFDAQTKIKTLFLTEGFFKAMKGSLHGIDVVGVASITHLKNKESGKLHEDIIKLMHYCSVERVVWLTDGDCLDVSQKALAKTPDAAEIDLRKRPFSFFSSITTFKQLLDDYEVEKYFMHIDTDEIWNEHSQQVKDRSKIKGLDDILVTFADKAAEIAEDINSVSKPGYWFKKFNITTGTSKVYNYFRLRTATDFILFQQERYPELKDRSFIFNGTKYKLNEAGNDCDVEVPGDSKLYFRVGDTYYKWLQLPNQYNQLEKQFQERSKVTITDDHKKDILKYIPKYEAFCNVPSHLNFQQVIHNCFNVYSEIDFKPEEEVCNLEDFPSIYSFLNHIFGDRETSFIDPNTREKKTHRTIDLALDYLQLNYLNPQQKLPILCLVSRENNTGKSTFANFLRIMLGSNVAIVGNQDLSGDFNAHWSTKSVVVCDETKIDKQHVVEKIKSLSTARKIWVNAKGKGQFELDCFLKFVLITNNEESFIFAQDDDIRYWVIKVPVLKAENPDLLNNFNDEMPAFLSFLSNRKLATEKKGRMWFHPSLLKTEALQKVIEYSKPTIEKELILKIRDKFLDFGVDELLMSLQDVHKEFFNMRYEANYLKSVITTKLKVDLFHKTDPTVIDPVTNEPKRIYQTKRYTYPRYETINKEPGKTEQVRVDISCLGRPYVFSRAQFLKPDEIAHMHITPEDAFINETTQGGIDFHSKLNPPKDKPEDLPF